MEIGTLVELAAAGVIGAGVALAVSEKRVQLARRDPMTGLDTRPGFEKKTKRMLGRGSVMVAVLDLDGLKKVNDQQGHEMGDRFIVQAAKKMREHLPAQSVVARIGGDEFAAAWLADHYEGPENLDLLVKELKVSVGVVLADQGCGYSKALGAADQTMYLMKSTGGGWGYCGRANQVPPGAPRRWRRDPGRVVGWDWGREEER